MLVGRRISQGIAQPGLEHCCTLPSDRPTFALVDVDVLRPTDALAGDKLQDSVFRVALARDVPVAVEKPLRKFIVRLKTDEVTDV